MINTKKMILITKPIPLLLDYPTAAQVLGVSVTYLHVLVNSGKIIEPLKIGGRRLFSYKRLEQWIDAECPKRADWLLMKN